ncbi:MAG: hypothetical protein AB7K52_13325 [Phycisphaerales bacterium]
MNTPPIDPGSTDPAREPDAAHDSLAPGAAPDAPPAELARQQFMHGLLAYLHLDNPARQQARVRATLDALHAQPTAPAPRVLAFPRSVRPAWHALAGVAAALALTTLLILFVIPTTPSATAMVQSSIDAAARAGDRRYDVRIMPPLPRPGAPAGSASELIRVGEIDLRGAGATGNILVRATNPLGDRVAFGRDASGPWTVRPDGQISRLNAAGARPRWIEFGESTILLDSIESLLVALQTEYGAERLAPEAIDGSTSGELFDRIRATRKNSGGPEPQRIEVWINRDTRLAQRVELHWPEFKPRDRTPGSGPVDPRRRPARPGTGAPAEFDDPGDRPPPPRHRDGHRPPPSPFGPDGPGDRPPPPPRDGAGGFGGPEGPDGPDGPRRGDPRGPRPRFLDGPPDFGHEHRPPPRKIVFELAPADPFADDWFSPEAHTAWVRDAGEPE